MLVGEPVKVISLTLFNRPVYAARALEALSKCDGIGDYRLVIRLDHPINPEIDKLCKQIDWCTAGSIWSKDHSGCNRNTFQVIEAGFEHGDYVIHLEEDVLVGPDTLRFFEWARQFQTDPSVLTVGAWGCGEPGSLGREHEATKVNCFHCWGWATWADRWEGIAKHWTDGTDQTLSWDTALDNYRKSTGRCEIAPLVSRTINIGAEGGVHRGEWLLPYWAGSDGFWHSPHYKLV